MINITKKLSVILAAAVMTVMLSGCNGVSESDPVSTPSANNSGNLSENDPTSTPQANNDSGTQSDTQTTSVTLDPEIQKLIDTFPLDTFIGFDGKEVKKTDAVGAMQLEEGGTTYLTYDFAYLRYAKPIWKNTLLDKDLMDWDTFEFDEEIEYQIADPNYFKVKAGDTLDDGLSVTKATTTFYPQFVENENGASGLEMWQIRAAIDFEGHLTLSGILHCFAGDTDYIDMDGDLYFYPNPTNTDVIVPSGGSPSMDSIMTVVDAGTKFVLVYDGQRISLGNVNDGSIIDLKGIIDKGEYRNATVTLDNIRVVYNDGIGTFINATLVSATTD